MNAIKAISLGLGLALCAVLPVAAKADFHSNTFRSPTGNLICKFNFRTIVCGAFSSDKVVSLNRYGRPLEGRRLSWDGSESWPVLQYGWRYNQGQPISCVSLFSGMKCQNANGWYFKIDRSRIFVGRYGQPLYWL